MVRIETQHVGPGGLGPGQIVGDFQGARQPSPQGFPVGQSPGPGPQVRRRLAHAARLLVQIRHPSVGFDIGGFEGQQALQGRGFSRLVADHPASARQAQRQLEPLRMGVGEDPVMGGGFGEVPTALQDQGRPHPEPVSRGVERQDPGYGLQLGRGVAARLVALRQRGPEPWMAGISFGERLQPGLGLRATALPQESLDGPDLVLEGRSGGPGIIRFQHATRPRSTRPTPSVSIIGCGDLR